MKICIVTVYNSENCGSFFQAYALYSFLTQKGHSVRFLEREVKDSSHSDMSVFIETLKCCLRRNYRQINLIVDRHRGYKRLEKTFQTVTLKKALLEADLFIIGSDTVWDFSSVYFNKHAEIYTGSIFHDRPFIFYAASCANTSTKDIVDKKINISSIEKARGIAVRDNSSQVLVNDLLNLSSEIVLDPTLIIPPSCYDIYEQKDKVADFHYILIYTFGKIKNEFVEGICIFAKSNKLKIVSVGTFYSWADYCISATPEAFITYYKMADYVFTNTFHGTVFSIIYNKRFWVLSADKNKINEFLNGLGLQARVLKDKKGIEKVVTVDINYLEVNNNLNTKKMESLHYLNNQLLTIDNKLIKSNN